MILRVPIGKETALGKIALATATWLLISMLLAACRSSVSQRPGERWIEVSLAEQKVWLHEGDEIVAEYLVSAGVGISPETTTYPGEYHVQTMYRGPEESSPGVFVKDVVIFDWEHGNGFHSLPMDTDGTVLDSTLGKPASAGCIRLADSDDLYQFAKIGMKVLIH